MEYRASNNVADLHPPCILCCSRGIVVVRGPGSRRFFWCENCDLVFVHPDDHVSRADEKARYELHDNSAQNSGYVSFLSGVADTVSRLPLKGKRVLDFGSGPRMLLTGLLSKRGYDCMAYDPLYGIGMEALGERYDAIVACEVAEHLREPRTEFQRMRTALVDGGFLVIHTLLRPTDISAFADWWYARDITHVAFYSALTFEYVARALGTRVYWTNERDTTVIGPYLRPRGRENPGC